MPDESRNAMPAGRADRPLSHGDPARRARIAIAAYYRAERRGFAPGHEVEDWLEAEREVDGAAAAAAAPAPDTPALLTSKPSTPQETTTRAKAPKPRGGAERTGRR